MCHNLFFVGLGLHLLRDFENKCKENGGFGEDFEFWGFRRDF
jgi:hypothetical protein